MHEPSYYRQLIEERIKGLALPVHPVSLYDPVRYMMGLGGKRVRPVLALMACELFGGYAEDAIKPALAMEVFHNFTLVHDDIMDQSPLRRGQKTVHQVWGEPTAILAGDVMLVQAYDLLCGIKPGLIGTALTLFNDTAFKVCEGQQLDMDFESAKNVAIEEYIHMIGLKTAVLLAGSLKMGALVAGASAEDAENIYRFGYLAGIAFQLQDDLLDAYGSQDDFGKKIGGDIAANKKTFLTLKAFEMADVTMQQELHNLFYTAGHAQDEKIRRVLNMYDDLGIKAITEKERDSYFSRAVGCLNEVSAPDADKQSLLAMAEMLIDRKN